MRSSTMSPITLLIGLPRHFLAGATGGGKGKSGKGGAVAGAYRFSMLFTLLAVLFSACCLGVGRDGNSPSTMASCWWVCFFSGNAFMSSEVLQGMSAAVNRPVGRWR